MKKRIKIPRTLKQAVRLLLKVVSDKDKKYIGELEKDELYSLHMSLGLWIRNEFGLWIEKSPLMRDIINSSYKRVPKKNRCYDLHPDTASSIVIEKLWGAIKTTQYLKKERKVTK